MTTRIDTILNVTIHGTPRGEGLRQLSVTEHAVLGLLAEGPSHGFSISKRLTADSEVGRIITVRRPLVYRALDRLVDSGLAEPVTTEKGSGPNRVIHRVTRDGRRESHRWLSRPVDHVREIRIEFLLKIALLIRSRRSPGPLIAAQRASLEPTLRALDELATDDHVEIWRKHAARAAAAFLDELNDKFR
jgi:PadR family transcriptional regulator AphA